ncbi:MAG: MATE family efflux transporter [Lachnospiraceae bacterium]|nr:MATE family efflux transporter [Lachnospiraceae bacterium]
MNVEMIQKNEVEMILKFSIPSIIAMVLTSMITIADGFFMGNYIGKEAIAAVNMGLPIIYLYLALGLMLSVGGIAIAGMALGGNRIEECNNVFNQTMVTTTAISIVLSMVVFLFFSQVMDLLHVNSQVEDYFKRYYMILLWELPIMVINSSFGMFIRGEGNPQFFMKVNILNVVTNVILDYISVRWLHMGVEGIAGASLLSAILELLCILYFFWKKSKVYKIRRFTFSGEVLKHTILNGSSEFIGEMSMSISMYAYNWVIMNHIGVDGVAAFTVVGYTSYLFNMIIVGFGQGASPLFSFTYGAQEYELCRNIRKKTNLFVFLAGVVVMGLLFVASDWYSNLFVKNEVVSAMVHSGIFIFIFSFLFSGINTITSFYFTSIGKAKESAIISSARGFVVLLLCIFTLPVLWGMTGVWLASPVTEVITILISIYFIGRIDSCKILDTICHE